MKRTILIFHFLIFSFVFGQNSDSNYVMEYITTKQGLPHDYVTSIVSDNLNIKWIGTENGLTKYNGFNFENIKPSKTYSKLKNENIEVLFNGSENIIWIGTKSGGISAIDVQTNSIKNYNHLLPKSNKDNTYVTAIAQDVNGYIWIGTWENGVFVIDYKKNKLIKHIKIFSTISSIVKDGQSNMWFTHFETVSNFNAKSETIVKYNLKTSLTDLIFDAKRNKLWIGTSKNNLKIHFYDFKAQKIDAIETNVNTDFYKTLSLDAKNRLWIGTWGKGLYRSNGDLSKFEKIELVAENIDKVKSNYNTILKVHHDKNNQVWVSTANGGVVKLFEGKGFKNANKTINSATINGDFNFTAIHKSKNSLFVGTLYNGLFFGNDFNDLKRLNEIGNERILGFYEKENKLYIGTNAGFFIYDLILKKLIFTNKKILKITAFFLDNDNNLFIGTQQKGIIIVPLADIKNDLAYIFYNDSSFGKFKIENNRISCFKEDSQGNIWVGTYNGIHLYDKEKKKFYSKSLLINDKLPSVIINSIAIKDDFLWLATPNGLVQLEYKNKKLIKKNQLSKENGLNSDFICDLSFDSSSNLWMSTKTEIVKYNIKNRTFTSFGENDGVKTTSFNIRSFSSFDNEILYFGGIDNITYFNPNTIKKIDLIPEVIYTTLRVNNAFIDLNGDKSNNKILDKNFSYVDKIKLTHDDKFFSIGFITNDFSGKLNIKYRYKLEGYQKNWLDLQNQNEINFAGLSSGTYVLKVAATRDSQTWGKSNDIEIEILNSPWKSIWAILGYILLILVFLYYSFKFYNSQISLENSLQIAKIDKEKEVELNEAKLNFFTNISHEFRTPLTLIISPMSELMENKDLSPKVVKKLSIIDQNANRLLNLINQLLDFRKAEYDLLQLTVSDGNIVRFSKEVYLYFREMAKSKDIKYKFKSSEDAIHFPFDRNKIEIVLCNLISNSIKYCRAGDTITIEVSKQENNCVILVKDTGIGMEAKNLEKIFNRFFQIKSAESAKMIGSGIGLAFSKKIIELHKGSIFVTSQKNVQTEFTIKLPLDIKYSEAEIDNSFINTDNIKAYDTKWDEKQRENLSIKTKENTILIIDDNPDIRDYLKDILSDIYTVFLAENGDEGFDVASAEIPDLIVSDVMMPGKDGIALCKELKSQIITSHIPIVLLTARSSAVYEIQGLETGADDYITKPFNPTIIKARISSLLENRKKLRKHLLNKIQFEPTLSEIETDTNTESAFIHKAIVLVEENLQNSTFSIETMVDELNMSQSTLYRKIKSLTGLSLTSFIRSIRLKKAAHLILIDDLNLSQIAYEVGFNDYKYFKISFEKQFQCLPSKYKAKITNKEN